MKSLSVSQLVDRLMLGLVEAYVSGGCPCKKLEAWTLLAPPPLHPIQPNIRFSASSPFKWRSWQYWVFQMLLKPWRWFQSNLILFYPHYTLVRSMTPFVKHICVAFENLRGFLRSVKGEIFLSEKPTDNKKYSKYFWVNWENPFKVFSDIQHKA